MYIALSTKTLHTVSIMSITAKYIVFCQHDLDIPSEMTQDACQLLTQGLMNAYVVLMNVLCSAYKGVI